MDCLGYERFRGMLRDGKPFGGTSSWGNGFLLALYQGDLEVFYAEVEELGKLPPEQRLAKLKDLGRKSLLANRKVIPDGLYGR